MKEQLITDLPTHLIIAKDRNIQVGWRYLGKYIKFSCGTQNKKDADKIGKRIFDNWAKGHASFKALRKDAFDIEVDRYIRSTGSHLKAGTVLCIRRNLGRLKTALKLITVIDFNREQFDKNIEELRGDASPKYWVNIIVDIRKFVGWAIEEHLIPSDPTSKLVLPTKNEFKQKGRESVWPEKEFLEVCQRVTKDDSIYLLVLRYTGMDVSDLCLLEKSHIMSTVNGLLISKHRQKAKRPSEIIIQPINSRLKNIFTEAMARESDRLFSDSKDFRSWGSALYKRVMRIREKMKLPARDLKSLRHTFATRHVERGVEMDVLRKWMGHSKDSRTLELLYAHREDTAQFMD